jgi:hypothetical protein
VLQLVRGSRATRVDHQGGRQGVRQELGLGVRREGHVGKSMRKRVRRTCESGADACRRGDGAWKGARQQETPRSINGRSIAVLRK